MHLGSGPHWNSAPVVLLPCHSARSYSNLKSPTVIHTLTSRAPHWNSHPRLCAKKNTDPCPPHRKATGDLRGPDPRRRAWWQCHRWRWRGASQSCELSLPGPPPPHLLPMIQRPRTVQIRTISAQPLPPPPPRPSPGPCRAAAGASGLTPRRGLRTSTGAWPGAVPPTRCSSGVQSPPPGPCSWWGCPPCPPAPWVSSLATPT
mmetsp:Transcript_33620/g.82683  ORF Transcript_33620/g.82683 Transcript_33620/m.82683 type:complete len:203 (-) Transcript_33620:810-1418(-)